MRKRTTFIVGIGLGAIALGACAPLQQRAQHTTGLIDFMLAPKSCDEPDAFPVKTYSGGSVVVANAHAIREQNSLVVQGTVGRGMGYFGGAGGHLYILGLAAEGQVLSGTAASYSPQVIPSQRRSIGRSQFYARLRQVSPQGSSIVVAFHRGSMAACEWTKRG